MIVRRQLVGLVTAALALTTAAPFVRSASAASVLGDRPAVVRGNTWFLRKSLSTGTADITFDYGNPGDVHLFGDWDGDGDKTPGVLRGNTWYLRNSNSQGDADVVFDYGAPGDIPVVGDWNGDHVDTVGVVRGNEWFLRNTNSKGTADDAFTYGLPSDVPIVGDWDGDWDSNPGVLRTDPRGPYQCIDYCPEYWFLRTENSTGEATEVRNWLARDVVIGDWNADFVTTGGWVYPDGVWRITDETGPYAAINTFMFGQPGDEFLVWRI